MTRTAIVIDGGFLLRRFRHFYRTIDASDPKLVEETIYKMALGHLSSREPKDFLYRIFFYDCAPLEKKAHYPKSRRSVDFSRSEVAVFRKSLHDELRKMRKVALRLGHLSDEQARWHIREQALDKLLKGQCTFEDLTDDDFYYEAIQKGVDMKIGLDIASMAFKKQVDKIILISGDSDFVPAAKLARREGIDFIVVKHG